jgi:hypothetical protein
MGGPSTLDAVLDSRVHGVFELRWVVQASPVRR